MACAIHPWCEYPGRYWQGLTAKPDYPVQDFYESHIFSPCRNLALWSTHLKSSMRFRTCTSHPSSRHVHLSALTLHSESLALTKDASTGLFRRFKSSPSRGSRFVQLSCFIILRVTFSQTTHWMVPHSLPIQNLPWCSHKPSHWQQGGARGSGAWAWRRLG